MPRLKKKKAILALVVLVFVGLGYKWAIKPSLRKCSSSSAVPSLVDPKRGEGHRTKCQNGSEAFCTMGVPSVDIQMLEVYDKISFRHEDGGDWEEGWCVKHDPKAWTTSQKLKVFVVPHSHNDPGWLRTFDDYYWGSTKHILDGMLRNLKVYSHMKFVWAEISYFSRWFEGLWEPQKEEVLKLIAAKQLEIVTGGWVMPDEANSHWYSLVMQLSEGQAWLKRHLNVTPTSAWSIDPFGHSPTMTYVLEQAGFRQMVIGRTHYVVKKHLAMFRDLEFRWKQLWDSMENSGLLTHMLPFNSYAIKYSHGPYRKVAGLFDFRKTDKFFWPWEARPEEITRENVRARADLLVEQWLKKATLYRTRAILVPHGDDFRYRTQEEWDAQRSNLEKLFSFINNSPDYHVEVKFTTLSEYFAEVQDRSSYPSLSGDFFTYADEKEDYWSGYFTTRPFHKRQDRILLHLIRSAEIISAFGDDTHEKALERARRTHSLYQHHDGITGTAREKVVEDYARMHREAVKELAEVIKAGQKRSHVIATDPDDTAEFSYLKSPNQTVTLFNSLAQKRKQVVTVFSAYFSVRVLDPQGQPVPFQLAPVIEWTRGWTGIYIPRVKVPVVYRVTFEAHIPPMSLISYSLVDNAGELDVNGYLANFTLFHDQLYLKYPANDPFKRQFTFMKAQPFSILDCGFSDRGFLMEIGRSRVEVSFQKYLTQRWWADKSGPYLFLPRGQARNIYTDRRVVVIMRGPIENRVQAGFEFGIHETVVKAEEPIEISNRIDITHRDDQEIVMKIDSDVRSGDTFFTDLNGFQIIKRNRLKKLPLQANYYPVPAAIFIQDEQQRLTLLGAQPLGGSSLKSGQIEVMQDRRLTESDGRGLGEGVMDNVLTSNSFRLLFERSTKSSVHKDHPSGFHTKLSHDQMLRLLNPVIRISSSGISFLAQKSYLKESLPSGFEVVTIRKLEDESLGLVIHRTYIEGEEPDSVVKVNVRKLLGLKGAMVFKANILLTERYEKTDGSLSFPPMSTQALIVSKPNFGK